MKNLPYLLLLLLLVPQAWAGPFDPPPTDQSVNLLGIIFGDSIGDLYLGGNPNPVLTGLMEKFNFIIVVVGTVVVSYVAIMSTINTAHEGSAMGKKWSAVWIPMRSVIGMALLVPAPATGYSMIQVSVMWVILQGIGAADSLWNIALDGLRNGVSAAAGTLPDPRLQNIADNLVSQVLNADICMQAMYQFASTSENQNAKNWVNQNGQYVKSFTIEDPGMPLIDNSTGSRVATMSGYMYFGVDNTNDPDGMEVCGKINVIGQATDKDYQNQSGQIKPSDDELKQQADRIYHTKINAISAMLQILQPLAQGYAKGQYYTADLGPPTYAQANYPMSTLGPPGYKAAAAKAYVNVVSSLVVPLSGVFSSAGKDFSNVNVQSGSSYYGNINNQNSWENNAKNAFIDTGNAIGDAVSTPLIDVATDNFTTILDNSQVIADAIRTGENNGWVAAGSFYFIFNRTLASRIFENATSNISGTNIASCNTPPCSDQAGLSNHTSIPNDSNNVQKKIGSNNDLFNLALLLHYGNQYLQSADASTGVSSSLNLPTAQAAGDTKEASLIIAQINLLGVHVTDFLEQTLEKLGQNADPLLANSILGRDIMLVCEMSLLAIIGILMITVASAALGFFIGFGFALMTLANALAWLLGIVAPYIAFVWAFGAMLAIYCPLIPFMIFTMGVLGWLLAVVESIIAAPLIALGLVMPSGDELGKLENALMILANIFLRPMLMIFGFLLAGRVYKAIVYLVNFGMLDVFKTINVATLFSSGMIMFVYTTFIISLTNVSFSLIYAVPDKILRWLGHGGETTQADLSEVKGKAQESAQQTGGAVQELASKGGEKAHETGQALNQKAANFGGLRAIAGRAMKSLGKKKEP